MPRLLALIAAALLAACASTPQYVPAPSPDAAGYTHSQIESNRYFVTYRAPKGADRQLVEDFALLRAAELTLQQGADWFVVDRRSTDESRARSSGPSVGVGLGGGNYGRSSGVSAGVGFSIPLGSKAPSATSATVEIRTGTGEKPDLPNAYDARAVSASLRARTLH